MGSRLVFVPYHHGMTEMPDRSKVYVITSLPCVRINGIYKQMNTRLTVFQNAEKRIVSGEEPLEYPIFRDAVHGVTASVDPYNTRQYGVVIYGHEAPRAGAEDHLFEGTLYRTLQLQTVAQYVGEGILRVARQNPNKTISPRVRLRVDGNQIPDHAHVVMAMGAQEVTGKRLEHDELLRRQELLRFSDDKAQMVSSKLALLYAIRDELQ